MSWAGRSVWVPTPATHVTGATYAFGDFDGNGTTDILRSLNGSVARPVLPPGPHLVGLAGHPHHE